MRAMITGDFLEMLMMISFGIAWPTSIVKSVRSKTSKGKSIVFLIVALCGYLFGISAKFVGGRVNFVLIFYVINACMVATDVVLYFINARRDRLKESAGI